MRLKVCNSEDYVEEMEESVEENGDIDDNNKFACVMSMVIMFVFVIGMFFML